ANVGSGVFVSAPGLQVGDLVTVTAQVMEYQSFNTMPRTVLVNSTTVINSSGNELPILILDAGRPIPNSILTGVTPDYTDSADGAGDTFDASLYALSFFETVEGMLVTIPDMVVADGFIDTSGGQPFFQAYSTVHADPDQINDRGGYTIAGDPPLSPPDTADSEDGTIFGGRHLHDGDVNPDIIEVDFTGFAIDAPAGWTQNLSMGDRIGDVTGIIDFDFTDRKLFVTDIDETAFIDGQPVQEVTVLGDDSRALTVATFNVENLDPTDGAARFAEIANAIAVNLNAPDIISIEEMQDNNGGRENTDPSTKGAGDGTSPTGTDASLTWQMLVDALNLATGAHYQWVDQAPVYNAEGGQNNGNIRVGFLYNTDRVQLGDLPANATIAERRQYTDRIGDGVRDAGDLIQFSDDMVAGQINPSDWSSTRLSLLGQFTFHGNTVFVTANHFTAKGGSGQFWQYDQTLEQGDPENSGWAKRAEQANDVYAMLNHIQQNTTGTGIVAGGDFNDFYFYRPLEVLTGYVNPDGTARAGGARFDNLTLTLAEAERYTYTFDGRSQAIDHIIVNSTLSGVATYDIVHLNTGYNGLGTDPGLSDHEPALASFDFRTMSETLTGTPGNDVFLMHQGGDDTVYGLGGRDIFYFGAAYTNDDMVDGGADRDTLILQGVYDITFSTSSLISVEAIVLLSSSDNRYGGATAGPNSYDLSIPAGLAGGELLIVNAGGLAANETLIFDGSAETTAPFNLYGGAGADNLTGGGGHDHLDGGAGIDVMTGGSGNDNYIVNTGDHVFELSGGGNDKVFARSSYVLTFDSHVEVLATIDHRLTTAIDLTGNQHNNAITGNEGANYLNGGAGDDHIKALGGDDYLTGGSGRDLLYGGAGNDGYEVDAFDLVYELENEGTIDIVYASSSYALLAGSHVERIQFANSFETHNWDLSGNEFGNRVAGNDGNNLLRGGGGDDMIFGFGGHDILDGGTGTDSLIGHSGNDIYYVDQFDVITETSDNGFDSAYSSTDYTLGAGVHVEVLATRNYLSTDGIDLTGNELNNSVTGNSGDNELNGMAGHDSLSGGAGNDLIDGGAGRDILAGGTGSDTFRFTSTSHSAPGAGDRITDFVSGTDTIDLSQIDANTNTVDNDAFNFIGTAAFSGTAGELRYDVVGGRMHIYGDTNGDKIVDLHIAVDGTIITSGDFAF
ncbi:M10 family metallopeptidase C-terminal domain-containing protein, partial [Allosphingosinicella sp.]|uniref:M10 family metallopeptidase C-terminal domain-containing protein n=1 Tax=Allosphingosinicella sp. TaxID=2823234 RepID=UPI002F1A0C99